MFDIVRNNRRVVQGLLFLIILPFAFFGLESYVGSMGTDDDVAKVGDGKVTQQEFREALREQQDRLRQSAQGRQIPASLLDSPEIRSSVLEMLINRHLINAFARQEHFSVSDEQLQQLLSSIPAWQENGQFSKELYAAWVDSQGKTKEGFEAEMRRNILLQQAVGGLSGSAIAGKKSADVWQSALLEEREVASVEFKPEYYSAQVKLAPDATRKYYDAHLKDFELPQQVRADFVVLSQASLMHGIVVSDAEIKAAYDARVSQYKVEEQRRASHILIEIDQKAPEAKVATAREKITALLAQVKKSPKDFASVAKKNSEDAGSAPKGGDLDWFSRGAMFKAFEDAAFALNDGEISGVVRTEAGFHIIQITGIRPGKNKSLAEASGEIEIELRQQASSKKFAEAAEAFTNMVYEQADSLQPAIEKFKLEVQHSGWIAKGVTGSGLASNPKLLAALFSDDAIKNKRNTEAVEVAPNTLVAARVVESKPASTMSFDEIKASIDMRLTTEEAGKLAAKDAEAKLTAARQGNATALNWGPGKRIARIGAENISRAALDAIFKAPVTTLPTYASSTGADGNTVVYRISRVFKFAGGDNPRANQIQEQYQQLIAAEEFSAWLGLLREQAGVEINQKVLDAKDER